MKYKAGDRVTIVIPDESHSRCINENQLVAIHQDMIVHHEPAPEPVVRYFALFNDDMIGEYHDLEKVKSYHYKGCIGYMRVTYNHATKEVKAEIVE